MAKLSNKKREEKQRLIRIIQARSRGKNVTREEIQKCSSEIDILQNQLDEDWKLNHSQKYKK